MKMKKIVPLVLAACTILTGCNHGGTGGNSNLKNETIIAAEGMTYDELLAKAKEEVGNGTVSVYGNSSQLETALKKFTEETGIKVNNTKEGDADIYNHLSTAFQSNTYIADMVLLQDGNMLQSEMLDPGYLLNFIPKEASGTIADDDTVPMAAVYLNKIFMYNNFNAEGTERSLKNYITNVWQLAGTAADKGHIANPSFKTPTTENVNMNFLVMLTSDAYVAKLKTAYKNFYGKDYVEEKAYKNIGYKWVAEFLKNSQAHSSDGTACKDVAKAKGGTVALVNYNKIKDLKGDDVYGAENVNNLSFPSLELGDKKVDGFGGFCYKMYSMVAANAKYPYAACALVSYITSKAGFENAWGAKAGYYSTNNTTKIASNDKEIAWWKERLVVEDPEVVAANYEDVSMFVKQYEGK